MIRHSDRLLTAFLLAATPLALLAPGAPLFAAEGRHGRPYSEGGILDEDRMERHAERQSERLTRALDLTAAQQATLAELQDRLEATVRPLGEAMRAAHERLRTLLDATSPDPMAVGTQAIAMDRARDDMRAAREKFEADFAATLTEAQRTTFRALQELRPEWDERAGRHFGGEPRRGDHPRR